MRPQRSLTSHRLFPPLVALWFGALFGLSTLAVRTSLFEQLVLSTGFDRLVPAAGPPLGAFARLLIAAAFGLAGAGLGWLVADALKLSRGGNPATVARPEPREPDAEYRVRPRDAHPDAPARRPISVHEDLGAPLLDADIAAWSAEPAGHDDPAGATGEDRDPPLPGWLRPAEPAPAEAGVESGDVADDGETLPAAESPAATGADAEAPAIADPDFPAAWRNTAERIAQAHPSALSHVELIERLAMAINKRESLGPAARPPALPANEPGDADPDKTIRALREALSTLRGV